MPLNLFFIELTYRRLISFGLFFLSLYSALAQDANVKSINIQEINENDLIGKYFETYEDSTNKISIENIDKQQFERSKDETINANFSTGSF